MKAMKELKALSKKYELEILAKKIGVSLASIYRWIGGYKKPSKLAQIRIKQIALEESLTASK